MISSIENDLIELKQDARKSHDHIVDSINLLMFTLLLILVILTIWLFKHKKFPYIHETGLAIIYGKLISISLFLKLSRNCFIMSIYLFLRHISFK